jgi:hypothetical protein
MNYKITYLILTTFLLLIFPSCDDDSKPDPTLDYCTQFNDMENKCQDNGCTSTPALKGYFHNSKCIGYQPGKFCLPPVTMCHNNVSHFSKTITTVGGTPYMYFTSSGCERYEWNTGETTSCGVEEESCNTNSTREDWRDSYCYWVQAKKAVLEENSCTGWETDNTNMCLGPSFFNFTTTNPALIKDMIYKPTDDGTEVFKIENFETNEKIGGFIEGYQALNFQGEREEYDNEKIYQWILFDIWEFCHLDNPICNCPEQ